MAGAEAALRLFNVAPPGVPARELFWRPSPVFERAGDSYRTTEKSARYILAQSFPAIKPAGTVRVFVAGGSTAMGFPLEGIFGPTQLIPAGLDAIDSGRQNEVINAAGFGYASYRVAHVVEEILDYEPDAVVVMTGHNEFLEWRFDRKETGVREKLSGLAAYRALAGLVSALKKEADEVRWEAHQPSGLERELVFEEFSADLRRMAKACNDRGVKLILVTCPSNLSGFRPYGPSDVSGSAQASIDGQIRAGKSEVALKKLSALEDEYSEDAWIKFEKARSILPLDSGPVPVRRVRQELEFFRLARDLFIEARDLDPIPVRAAQDFNEAIRKTAEFYEVELADADRIFASTYEAAGGPGGQVFFDHCHPDDTGQALLALSVLDALAGSGVFGSPVYNRRRVGERFDRIKSAIEDEQWADAYYKVGYEAGANMDRVHRGLRYARKAKKLDITHEKAWKLVERLAPLAEQRYELIGD
jgi:lysophospholipase L1-like esterase